MNSHISIVLLLDYCRKDAFYLQAVIFNKFYCVWNFLPNNNILMHFMLFDIFNWNILWPWANFKHFSFTIIICFQKSKYILCKVNKIRKFFEISCWRNRVTITRRWKDVSTKALFLIMLMLVMLSFMLIYSLYLEVKFSTLWSKTFLFSFICKCVQCKTFYLSKSSFSRRRHFYIPIYL